MNPEVLEAAARTLTVPTLLVRGRQSDLFSEEGAQAFLAMVPHAEFADVGGAGHMVAGDRNDAFNDAVIGFLQRIRDSAEPGDVRQATSGRSTSTDTTPTSSSRAVYDIIAAAATRRRRGGA